MIDYRIDFNKQYKYRMSIGSGTISFSPVEEQKEKQFRVGNSILLDVYFYELPVQTRICYLTRGKSTLMFTHGVNLHVSPIIDTMSIYYPNAGPSHMLGWN